MAQMRVKGEKFTYAELGLDRPARPDLAMEALEVAAARFKALEQAVVAAPFEDLDGPGPDHRRVSWREPRLNGATRQVFDWDTAATAADQLQSSLAALHTALQDPMSDPGWNYVELASSGHIPNFVSHRVVAQSLHSMIMVELRRNDLVAAHRDLLTLIRLCRLNVEGWTLVIQMIRTALLGLTCDAVWNALQAPGWTGDQLSEIQQELERAVVIPQLPRTFEAERVGNLAEFDRYLREGPSSRAWLGQFSPTKRPPAWIEQPAFFFWRRVRSGKDRLLLLQFQQQVIERHRRLAAGVPFRELGPYPQWTPSWWNRSAETQALFPLSAPPNFVRATATVVRNDTERLLTIAALALERYRLRHGQYPGALGDLAPEFLTAVPKDAISGKPLRHRLLPDGHPLLYSVGFNGRDDSGDARPDPTATEGLYPPVGRDLVWRRPIAPGDEPVDSAPPETDRSPDPVLPLVDFADISLRDAIVTLARQAEINLIFDPAELDSLKQQLTLRLEEVTAREALEILLARHGLRLQEGSTMRITRVTRQ
jgi:hypothetical protein